MFEEEEEEERKELTVFSTEALYGLQEAAVELGRPLHPGSPGSDVPPHGFLLLGAAPHLLLLLLLLSRLPLEAALVLLPWNGKRQEGRSRFLYWWWWELGCPWRRSTALPLGFLPVPCSPVAAPLHG